MSFEVAGSVRKNFWNFAFGSVLNFKNFIDKKEIKRKFMLVRFEKPVRFQK
jgi:hypothetical protein